MAEDDRQRQADALKKMSEQPPSQPEVPPPPQPPRSAVLFRQARPADPTSAHGPARDAEPAPPSDPAPSPAAQPPRRPARPERPTAPPASSTHLAPPAAAPEPAPAALAAGAAVRTFHRKRTLIPILLTCGALLLATGAGRWMVSEDSAFRLLSGPLSIALAAIGAVLLAVAVLNMLQVRDQISASAPPAGQSHVIIP